MNDDTLTTALDRMTTALEPPAAADQLIDTRRAQLRRRRRATTGLAAASVVAIVATGGVLASSFGNASPQPDNTPVTSDGPAPSEAIDETDTAPEVRENDGPWRCSGADPMTPREVEVFKDEVIQESRLGMELVDDKVRAYVVLADENDAVYQLEARRLANDEVEIVAVVRCAG
jgi:hypothetical protein